MTDWAENLASRYNLANSPDWQALLTHFELGEGFAFIVLLVTNDDGAEVCRAALDRYLHEKGKRVFQIPVSGVEDVKHMAGTLLALQAPSDAGAIWLARAVPEGVPEFPVWWQAWREGAARLNQFRNPLRHQFGIPVIFAGSPWLQQALRENAPDLWSVRTLVARVEPTPVSEASGERLVPHMEHPPERGPDPEMALSEARRLREKGGSDLGVARLLYRAGLGFASRYQWREAADAFGESLALRKRTGGSAEDVADSGFQLGKALTWLTEYDRAIKTLSAAKAEYRRIGNVLGEANCIGRLGDIRLRRSDHESARSRYEKALRLYRRVGDVLGEANCIARMGDIALRRSDNETARSRYEEALPLHRRVGDVLGEANCIQGLGEIALHRSDLEMARSRYKEVLPLYRRTGDVLGEANCIKRLGEIAAAEDKDSLAKENYKAALALYFRIPEPYSAGWTCRHLARIAANEVERTQYKSLAIAAWESIGRRDLIEDLEREFPTAGSPAPIS